MLTLLAEANFVAVCCQWTPQTTNLLNEAAFAAMPDGVIVVNVARGEIIDEAALLSALQSGKVAGAALDVFVGEFEALPPAALWHNPNVLITPHTSGMNDARKRRFVDCFCHNLQAYLNRREMLNVIDWQAGY